MHPTSVVIMTRAPIAGETKTRLHPALGPEAAAQLAAAFFEDTLRNAMGVSPDVSVAVAGAVSHPIFDGLPVTTFAQEGGTLGDRIEKALAFGMRNMPGALVIGSDSPNLPSRLLRQAAKVLDESEPVAVIGPAADGGFYLLGVNRSIDGLLAGVPWSHATTCEATRWALADAGFAVRLLSPWYDVDVPESLVLLRAHLRLRPQAAPATSRLLRRLSENDS